MAELTRRQLLKSVCAATAGAAAYSWHGPLSRLLDAPARASTAVATWNHDPASPIGPYHWAEIGFPVCGQGQTQSPIDIATAAVRVRRGAPLRTRYRASELTIENTGHVLEVPIPAGVEDLLEIDGETYRLTQYHFHAPSEHAVDGRLADVEAHLVHENARGEVAVVAVLFWFGPNPNPLLERVLRSGPTMAGEEIRVGEANPAQLLHGLAWRSRRRPGRVRIDSFYAYEGSLTTPGCSENVRWSVLTGRGQVSRAAVRRFHRIISQFPGYDGYPNNNRPLQPLNGRVVELRCGHRR